MLLVIIIIIGYRYCYYWNKYRDSSWMVTTEKWRFDYMKNLTSKKNSLFSVVKIFFFVCSPNGATQKIDQNLRINLLNYFWILRIDVILKKLFFGFILAYLCLFIN